MSNKKGKEAKVERMTWFAMILVFMLLRFDRDVSVPPVLVPFTIALILTISGIYQLTQKWPVSPFVWLAVALLVGAGIYDIYLYLPIDLVLFSLLITIMILVVGILSNEG